MRMRIKPPTSGQKIAANMNNEVDQLKAEIVRLNEKIHAMRGVLWEWNCSSDMVWEYWKLKQVGEKAEDYVDWTGDEEDDMPLPDNDDDTFMERF